MPEHGLDLELKRRLELVENPAYEGESLKKSDQVLLFIAGIVVPLILMIGGWFI